MPRALTPRGLRAAQAEVVDAAWLTLVTITYPPEPATVFRAVDNTVPITSRGNTFFPFPFQYALAEDSLDAKPNVEARIDNISLELVDMLRAAAVPPVVRMEIIVSDAPDIVEVTIDDFILRNASWDAKSITLSLQLDDIFSFVFPSKNALYDPFQYPGLFT